MGNWFHELALFIWAVVTYWQAFLTGGIVMAGVAIYERKKRSLSWQTFLFIALAFLLFSAFQAWRDQYERAETLQHPSAPAVMTFNVPQAPPAQVILESPPTSKTLTPAAPSNPISYRPFQIKPTIGLGAPADSPGNNNPGIEIVVTAEKEISYPAFEATCDRPCQFSYGIAIMETTKFNALPSSNENVAKVEFVIPALWAKGKQIAIDLRSKDGSPIALKHFKLIKREGVD